MKNEVANYGAVLNIGPNNKTQKGSGGDDTAILPGSAAWKTLASKRVNARELADQTGTDSKRPIQTRVDEVNICTR
jgi:hypothetical protein